MKRAIIVGVLACLLLPSTAVSGTQDSAILAMHLKDPIAKTSDQCGVSPLFAGIPCSEFDVTGPIGRGFGVFLMVGRAHTAAGIMGVSCSISFPRDIVYEPSWILCGDMEFPGIGWPDSGTTNLITWDPSNCQRATIEQDGGYALAGFLLVSSYAEATLELDQSPNPNYFVTDCAGDTTRVQTPGGIIGFGTPGYTPCDTATPTVPKTWGRIKTLYRD